jgi:hypothetical protein
MLVLALTLILMVVFFLYVRQKMIIFENRLELMSQTIQTMAGVTRAALQDVSDEESEHSDSDSSEEDEQLEYEEPELEVYPERVTVSDDDVKKVSLPENEILEELEVKKIDEPEELEVKKLTLSSLDEVKSLDSLTLKELKDKVAELNGPKLKTKKELIDFLQNKI